MDIFSAASDVLSLKTRKKTQPATSRRQSLDCAPKFKGKYKHKLPIFHYINFNLFTSCFASNPPSLLSLHLDKPSFSHVTTTQKRAFSRPHQKRARRKTLAINFHFMYYVKLSWNKTVPQHHSTQPTPPQSSVFGLTLGLGFCRRKSWQSLAYLRRLVRRSLLLVGWHPFFCWTCDGKPRQEWAWANMLLRGG